jgi:hypothetical protein
MRKLRALATPTGASRSKRPTHESCRSVTTFSIGPSRCSSLISYPTRRRRDASRRTARWHGYCGGVGHFQRVNTLAHDVGYRCRARSLSRPGTVFTPMTAPDEMATLWRELGMVEVEQISLLIRMEFSSFEDYWRPFTTGAIHRRILRGSPCPADQECEARRSRRPSRRSALVRDGDLGRPRHSALALSAA